MIIQRDARYRDNGTLAWIVGKDERDLDLRDCGCGQPVTQRTVRANKPPGVKETVVIEVIFFHNDVNRCQMAFDCAAHFKPLTYGAYCRLMEIESDEEE